MSAAPLERLAEIEAALDRLRETHPNADLDELHAMLPADQQVVAEACRWAATWANETTPYRTAYDEAVALGCPNAVEIAREAYDEACSNGGAAWDAASTRPTANCSSAPHSRLRCEPVGSSRPARHSCPAAIRRP
jgi:hypothetical protein